MSYYEQLINFLNHQDHFFIEVEGKPGTIDRFISQYNSSHSAHVTSDDDGIIVLYEDANKWGLECRLYVSEKPTIDGFKRNTVYRPEYRFRLNDNKIIQTLLNNGFNVGLN